MTEADLKKLDKQIRQICDPFGEGFQVLKKILKTTADQQRASTTEIVQRYIAWKWRK